VNDRTPYPHLLSPLTLGSGPGALTLRNRVVHR